MSSSQTATSSANPDRLRTSLKHDLPASIVVFLVALPLCMGVAIASGAPVAAGLITGIVGGLIVGTFSGAPLQVSGPAAGLTVIIYQLIQEHGIEQLGVVVLLAGLLQLIAGLLHLGQWFRAVAPSVIQGMLAGIGILIFSSQFHVMVDDKPKPTGIDNLLTIPQAIEKGISLPTLSLAADRHERAAHIQQVGQLHLLQEELRESVHHLASGIPALSAVDPVTGLAAEPTTSVDMQAVENGLATLIPQQRQLVEQLREFHDSRGATELQSAMAATEAALADLVAGDARQARVSQDEAAAELGLLRSALKDHRWAAAIGLLTIVLLVGWQAFRPARLKALPAPLLAILVATAVAASLDLPVLSVEIPDRLTDAIYFPTLAELQSAFNGPLLIAAVEIAVIASAETLLCATATDRMHSGPRTRYDRELSAQGIGNMICGLLCALPMTGVVVRSSANINAGARTRMSTILHGFWLLIFVAGLSSTLRLIPTASLAAILVYTGYKLIDFKSLKSLAQHGWGEVVIYTATLITIVTMDLLAGVLLGIALSAGKLLLTFTRLKVNVEFAPDQTSCDLRLSGSATFVRLPKLAAALEQIPSGIRVRIHSEQLVYIDHACFELLNQWEKQHLTSGGSVDNNWIMLGHRHRRRRLKPVAST